MEFVKRIPKKIILLLVAGLFLIGMVLVCTFNGVKSDKSKDVEDVIEETELVAYPGRTFSYKNKFNDTQTKQIKAAKAIGLSSPPKNRKEAFRMRSILREVKTNDNYIVDSLTYSIPYLVPAAAVELDRIGKDFADILHRNGLPHYRFYVTSILRTNEDIELLQKSGNINATNQSCHCYGTTFDIAYFRFDKVSRTHEYMHQDNLKLVLGQVLLNEQRAGRIYVKYEWKQACFHVTVRK